MRSVVILASLSLALFADFAKVLEGVRKSPLLEAKGYEAAAKRELYAAAKAKDRPAIDAALEGVWLRETPIIHLEIPPFGTETLPMGAKRIFRGEVALRYPIFSGFAITHAINKARYEALQKELEAKDALRRLYLDAAKLYGAIYAQNAALEAQRRAVEAYRKAYKKAEGFYAKGLIPKNDLLAIEAKMAGAEAGARQLEAALAGLQERLWAISGVRVQKVHLPRLALPAELGVESREDLLSLQKALAAAKEAVGMAKSERYPHLGVEVALRRFGDTLALDGDGYKNADESYLGARLEYRLYAGGERRAKEEAARFKALAAKSLYEGYLRLAKAQLAAARSEVAAAEAELEAAKRELAAAKEYARLVQGRFENQLASGDELARALADLYAARARKAAAEARLFGAEAKTLLQSSLQTFERMMNAHLTGTR
jgi:outer membrane protein TolC